MVDKTFFRCLNTSVELTFITHSQVKEVQSSCKVLIGVIAYLDDSLNSSPQPRIRFRNFAGHAFIPMINGMINGNQISMTGGASEFIITTNL